MTWQNKGTQKLAHILKKYSVWTDIYRTLSTNAFEWNSHENSATLFNVLNHKKRIVLSFTQSMYIRCYIISKQRLF
jgi:hypothetical protein